MRSRLPVVFLAVLALSALAGAGPAVAKGHKSVLISGRTTLKNGLRFEVSGDPGRRSRDRVVAGVRKISRERLLLSESYVLDRGRQRRSSERRLRSRFGGHGSIGMKFVPTGRRHIEDWGCVRFGTRRGVLRGHLRFRGGGGAVDLRRHRIRAVKTIVIEGHCRAASDDPVLLVSCNEENYLAAIHEPDGDTGFIGQALGRKRNLLRLDTVQKGSRTRAFRYADDLSRARLRPPPPFEGTGRFANDRLLGGIRWHALLGRTVRVPPSRAFLTRDGDDDCEAADPLSTAVARTRELRAMRGSGPSFPALLP